MISKTRIKQPIPSSNLFIMRLWLEDLGRGQTDWRGKIQYVNSGEACYFRDWLTLEAFVEEKMAYVSPEENNVDEMDETKWNLDDHDVDLGHR